MNEKEKIFISAVVYVRNCERLIGDFVADVAEFLRYSFEHAEIICVDDASADKSADEIRKLSDKVTGVSISLLSLSRYHGREAAMQGGVGLSVGDFVFEFDDPQAKPVREDMMKLYSKVLEGYDIASATSAKTRTSSAIFYRIFNKSADLAYDINTELFRILSRRAINRIGSLNKVISYRKVAYATSGLKYAAVDVSESYAPAKSDRKEKQSRRRLAVDSLLMFTNIGFKFSLAMTVIMMAIMIGIAVYAIVSRAMGVTVVGWTSTVLLVAFGFFGLFGILSVITKYLQLLMDINVKKTAFTFESVEKITRDDRKCS